MEATDGEIGKVEEFYFDDETWTIRYLVLKTENWLTGRKVLIPPDALLKTPLKHGMFFVRETKNQIINSPNIDSDKPVSRQQEIELYGHYARQGYWDSEFYGGGLGDLHLRSSRQVAGYHVHGTDGEIGHIVDFIIDDQSWKLLFLVVDIHNDPGEKKVLIAVSQIKQMQWNEYEMYVDLLVAEIARSEVFDASAFVDVQIV